MEPVSKLERNRLRGFCLGGMGEEDKSESDTSYPEGAMNPALSTANTDPHNLRVTGQSN